MSPRLTKTALHQAVLDQRIHQVRLLAQQFPHLLNCRDIYGQIPLTVACRLEDDHISDRIAKILIGFGTEFDIVDNDKRSALGYAAQKGRVGIVRRILKRSISLDLIESDMDGNSPLHLAAEAGQASIVEIFIDEFFKYNLNIDLSNNNGFTPLLIACKNKNYVSAYILLTKGGASPDKKDKNFELDAAGWIHKEDKQLFPYVGRNCERAPTSFYHSYKHGKIFIRNRLLYERALTPICRHVSQIRPLSMSTNLAKGKDVFPRESVFENGGDARQAVLQEIIRLSRRYRPISTKSCKTALLSKISGDKKCLGKSRINNVISQLFRLYSEQQLAKDALKLPTQTASHHKNWNSFNSLHSQTGSFKTSLPLIKVTS